MEEMKQQEGEYVKTIDELIYQHNNNKRERS